MGKVQQESVQMSVVALMEDPTKEAQEKLDSLQQMMPLIEENAMGLSEETEGFFLRLFQVDEEVAKKVEMLAALDPYKIGVRGVIRLVEIIRQNAQAFVEKTQKALVERYGIDEYYGIFGTGGDKGKDRKLNTLNISTLAGIVAGSVRDDRGKTLFPIVKVGSLAVTSNIGACNFMQALYPYRVDEAMVARQVARFGFAFLSPGNLGLPYLDNLMQARKRIFASGICDIVKIVVPSACLMDPSAQVTGVSDMRMLPFILAVFQHLMQTSRLKKGFIVHSYSGVDELHNQSLLIEVEAKGLKGYDLAPDMFDLEPCQLDHSQEKETLQEQIVYSKKILSYSPDIPGGLLDMVAWNSAALLTLPDFSIVRCQENLAKVHEALRSGEVKINFENYLAFIPAHSQESRM